MNRLLVAMLVACVPAGPVLADGGHHHALAPAVPTLKNQATTRISITDEAVTVTFGPIDLPSSHDGELAASLPKHIFQLPEDRYLIGYKSEVFTKDGTALPQNYLHHILMMNNDKPSVSCDNEPLFFAGAGLEMTEASFPPGYGVKLEKGKHLMSIVAFYHKAPPTKDVMARFIMYTARKGAPVKEMDVYQVGVNIVCYSKFAQRGPDQTDEGIEIKPGVSVHSAPLKFHMDGCVKFAYPHGHDELLMIALDNKTTKQTLLRTVPEVAMDGTFMAFKPHQIYKDAQGFSVNTRDEYEMTMVHHHPLHNSNVQHGMGNYLLYMTPGECSSSKMASSSP
jgi:hypothetical protein